MSKNDHFGHFSAMFKRLPHAQFFGSRGHFSQFAHSLPLFYAAKTACSKNQRKWKIGHSDLINVLNKVIDTVFKGGRKKYISFWEESIRCFERKGVEPTPNLGVAE